jgi:hypothetical protein
MGRRTDLRRDQVQEGRGLKRALLIEFPANGNPAKDGRTMSFQTELGPQRPQPKG